MVQQLNKAQSEYYALTLVHHRRLICCVSDSLVSTMQILVWESLTAHSYCPLQAGVMLQPSPLGGFHLGLVLYHLTVYYS